MEMISYPSWLRCEQDHAVLNVLVVPRSSKNILVGEHLGRLKIKLTSPPVDGKANEALLIFLAKVLDIPQRELRIIRGETSKQKSVAVFVPVEEVLCRIQKRISVAE